MDELCCILTEHAQRYPKMEPTDAVKLIYQNEFGGGHMIADEEACLSYLRREYEATVHDPQALLREPIGNGLHRVHLSALSPDSVEELGSAFIRSASAHSGSLQRFLDKLSQLRELTAHGVFAFDIRALDAYLADYRAAGYPAVSHSSGYRSAYHPAYRIVLADEFA